ncbi:hypothetical protein LEN26_006222 [Aphanomyces euteiches]|uniref:Uncharacterized protein n=1 Tax=Aphanomyces euteiches TaxID=100861 RepID=A0A6G0WX91_9STRA|nr:hypothetical protein Ae201684_010801 [Aphanomyces euteiches]KAH9061405.1 hypothetical protein Ae201684P_020741 [Aphanomyces euteiches]KAH9128799.1 hypothetical protein AeMF1_001093 [Aphanomyces euteiches]KAH9136357.1 hypothetical protein LEN26_006222 [Aphanomyces euteiches]KAH9144254.1 hypothetical protein AeRB84_011783 [Aphanomyces euteiches]
MRRQLLCLVLTTGASLVDSRQEIYRWDPSTQQHIAVFSYSNREHEMFVSQDPRHRKLFLAVTNGDPPKKAHVKVVERKHSYPLLASIISIAILLTTIFMIIKYTT